MPVMLKADRLAFALALTISLGALVLDDGQARGAVVAFAGLAFFTYKERPSRSLVAMLGSHAKSPDGTESRAAPRVEIDAVVVIGGVAAVFGASAALAALGLEWSVAWLLSMAVALSLIRISANHDWAE